MKFTKSLIGTLLLLLTITTNAQERFKAYNGVEFDYEVILPEGYKQGKSYELAMVFTQIEVEHEGYESTLNSLKAAHKPKNTILFIPKVPLKNPHWISHPIHHGLNDLMKSLRKQYGQSDQRFHFIGHLFGGRVAQTYSGMSSEYVASVSFINSKHWSFTKQRYFDEVLGLGFPVYVYDQRDQDDIPLDVSKTTQAKVTDFMDGINRVDHRLKQ